MRRIVIIGSGFAGLHAARALAKEVSSRRGLRLTVVSDQSHFLFTPLWGSVASGTADLAQVAIPAPSLLPDDVQFELDRVLKVDLAAKRIVGDRVELDYDFLVVAVGATTDWGTRPDFEQVALPCRSGRDAVDAHESVERAFSAAEATDDPVDRRRALTFVVVGGGPTGVELISRLASRLDSDTSLRSDFVAQCRLVLVEQQPEILAAFPQEFRRHATTHLEGAGVELRIGEAVVECCADRVELSSRDAIGCSTIFWCGGVKAPGWLGESGFELDATGRVVVHRTLQAVGYHGVYIAGDAASPGEGVPMTADVAVDQAATVAQNIVADLAGRSRRDWRHEPAGVFLALGHANALASYRGVVLAGRPAQALWGAVATRLIPAGVRGLSLVPNLFAGAFAARSPNRPDLLTE